MQMLHPAGRSIQQYRQEISDPDHYRPASCPQCQARCALIAHGFYCRTLVDVAFNDTIRARRYLFVVSVSAVLTHAAVQRQQVPIAMVRTIIAAQLTRVLSWVSVIPLADLDGVREPPGSELQHLPLRITRSG
jgi:hypothetical protein